MKNACRILKLLPPACLMRLWLDKRYGIKVPLAPGGVGARFALAALPYAFTAALNVRVESDCRLLKYFLPYGRMSNFVRMTYGIRRGNVARDHGIVGFLRSVMPYGLVLWWDAEDARMSGQGSVAKSQEQKLPKFCGRRIPDKERQEMARMDRIEAMTLRLLIVSAGRERK